jgi:hypothetical protein
MITAKVTIEVTSSDQNIIESYAYTSSSATFAMSPKKMVEALVDGAVDRARLDVKNKIDAIKGDK